MSGTQRYVSRNLSDILEAQGRKRRWLAGQVGVSDALMYKIALGRRSANHELAEKISKVLGQPFFLLWELHERSDSDTRMEAA